MTQGEMRQRILEVIVDGLEVLARVSNDEAPVFDVTVDDDLWSVELVNDELYLDGLGPDYPAYVIRVEAL